jgi:hypothetical protein
MIIATCSPTARRDHHLCFTPGLLPSFQKRKSDRMEANSTGLSP